MEDQRVIKGKFEQNGIRSSWSLILEGAKTWSEEEGRREEEEEEEKKGMELYGN